VEEEGYLEEEKEDGDYGDETWGSDVLALGFPDPGVSGPATFGAIAPKGSAQSGQPIRWSIMRV